MVVDRSPMDIALSMRKRDGRPLYVALAIWQLYCTELLDGLAGRRVLLVHYEDFVADPARSGPLLLQQLTEVLPPEVAPHVAARAPRCGEAPSGAGEAVAFVSPEMRHHRTEAEDSLERASLDGRPAISVPVVP